MGEDHEGPHAPDTERELPAQTPPGALGPHANPTAPGTPPPAPPGDVPATGAAVGPHPPEPGSPERRLVQAEWEHWRAQDRRRAPFHHPDWRT
jgi:hypothetical protein